MSKRNEQGNLTKTATTKQERRDRKARAKKRIGHHVPHGFYLSGFYVLILAHGARCEAIERTRKAKEAEGTHLWSFWAGCYPWWKERYRKCVTKDLPRYKGQVLPLP